VLLGLSMIDMNAEGGNINSMWSVHLTSVYWRGSSGCTIPLHFQHYVLFEAPSNFAMKHFSPSVWIGRIMISWGAVTICCAAVFNFEGLLAIRFFLGIAEAGFFPG
jgi:hypothetical protein